MKEKLGEENLRFKLHIKSERSQLSESDFFCVCSSMDTRVLKMKREKTAEKAIGWFRLPPKKTKKWICSRVSPLLAHYADMKMQVHPLHLSHTVKQISYTKHNSSIRNLHILKEQVSQRENGRKK